MNEAEAIEYLSGRVNYERREMPASQELRLDRMFELLARLGNPHAAYPIIHLTGTKGKSSTAGMIARLLQHSSYKVGLHTSPHLHHITERFLVDGEPATVNQFAQMVTSVKSVIDDLDQKLSDGKAPLTYFEITTALAFLYFAQQKVDIAVIEVGMGGRLDATNVVTPKVSVITSIGLDHTKQLGDTRAKIAFEKAGIIKPGVPVVSSVVDDEAGDVIRARAAELGCQLYERERDYQIISAHATSISQQAVEVKTWRRHWPTLSVGMPGEHQQQNLATALAALDALEVNETNSDSSPDKHVPGFKTRPELLADCLAEFKVPARVEVIAQRPMVVVDAAHNLPSIEALLSTLKQIYKPDTDTDRRVLVFASSKDKDWPSMLDRLRGYFDTIVVTRFVKNPRAVSACELHMHLANLGINAEQSEDPSTALELACRHLPLDANKPRKNGLLCVAGSIFLASELREELINRYAR